MVAVVAVTGGCGAAHDRTGPATPPRGPGRTVPMTVQRQGPGVTPYVPVTIDGRRYTFRLDTGATRAVISTRLAGQLRLPARGRPFRAGTLGCVTAVRYAGIGRWALGDVRLGPTRVATQADVAAGQLVDGSAVSGLLGASVLARFRTVTLDFTRQRLILGAPPPAGGRAIPMTVHRERQDAVYVTVPGAVMSAAGAVNSVRGQWLIDSGAQSTLVSSRTATRAGLRSVGARVTAHGAAGCAAQLTPVAIGRWTAGDVRLPATLGLSSDSAVARRFGTTNIDGVIGADVLAAFGRVTLDFASGRLVLGPR